MVKKLITKARIVGLIAVIIAAIGYMTQQRGSTPLGIAGIILCLVPRKQTSKMFDSLIKTFKRWKILLYSALADAGFWIFFFITLNVLEKFVTHQSISAQGLMNFDQAQFLAAAGSNVGVMKTYLLMVGIGLVVFAAVNIFTYTISRGYIWTLLTGKKQNYKKFFGLNSLWWGGWIALLLLVATTVRKDAVAMIFVLMTILSLYFTLFVHYRYVTKGKVMSSIPSGLGLGIRKVFSMIVPYTFLFFVYVILFQAYRFVPQQGTGQLIATIVLTIILVTIQRTYLYEVVKKL